MKKARLLAGLNTVLYHTPTTPPPPTPQMLGGARFFSSLTAHRGEEFGKIRF